MKPLTRNRKLLLTGKIDMQPAKILQWPSKTAEAAPPATSVQEGVEGFDLADTMAFPFVGLELRAYVEMRTLCASAQQPTGELLCTLSVEDLCRACTALDNKRPSKRSVSYVLQFLERVCVVERRPSAGRRNVWRILPTRNWLAPEAWAELRRQVRAVKKEVRTKPQIKKKMNVVHVQNWSHQEDDLGPDPLNGPAALLYQEIFRRSPTIDFATRYLAQIQVEDDLRIWRKVLQWYRFQYQKGNITPRPDTLWRMFCDWRVEPHKVRDLPEPILQATQTPPPNYHGNKTNRNSTAAAETLSLFEEPTE